MLSRIILSAGVFATLAASLFSAELTINRHFSDHMVLQRNRPIVVRGTATAGAEVTVTFSGQKKIANADESGAWVARLEAVAANAKPSRLTVASGKSELDLKDVVVGDVIFFGRQTTIDISLGRDETGRKAAASHNGNSLFRAIVIKTIPAPRPLPDMDPKATTGWKQVDRDLALSMSAAAYYMGLNLAKDTDIPVGIVDVNMNWHFPIAWISKETLADLDGVERHVERFTTMQDVYENDKGSVKSSMKNMKQDELDR